MKRLSRNDIETISEKFVKAYFELPEIKKSQVYRIEPELMLEKVLGLTIEYMHLSYDGSILGMTSFGELGVQVFENNDDEAFFFLDGKTVLVESDLNYDNNLKGRKNNYRLGGMAGKYTCGCNSASEVSDRKRNVFVWAWG